MRLLLLLGTAVLLVALVQACNGDGGSASDSGDTAGRESPRPAVSPGVVVVVEVLPDAREFLGQFVGVTVIQERCTYREDLDAADCGEFGRYRPVPLPAGEGLFCALLLVEREPVAMTCRAGEPAEILYYPVEALP